MPAYFWSGAGFSRRGGRSRNEDDYYLDGTFLPEGGEDTAPRALGLRSKGLMAVFDGMGGEAAGDYASFTAAKLLHEQRTALLGCRDMEGFRTAAGEYVRLTNASLRKKAEDLGSVVGAAMALLLLRGSEAMLCSLGDCRIYLLRGGKLSQLTQDHTLAAFLQRRGDLTPEQARTDKRRHALMRHLGSTQGGDTLIPGFRRLELEAGDRFLLCSDGVSAAPDKELARILGKGSPAAAVKNLLEAAEKAGSKDNLTALCVQVQMRVF